jgi:hypothetical protein
VATLPLRRSPSSGCLRCGPRELLCIGLFDRGHDAAAAVSAVSVWCGRKCVCCVVAITVLFSLQRKRTPRITVAAADARQHLLNITRLSCRACPPRPQRVCFTWPHCAVSLWLRVLLLSSAERLSLATRTMHDLSRVSTAFPLRRSLVRCVLPPCAATTARSSLVLPTSVATVALSSAQALHSLFVSLATHTHRRAVLF